MKIPIPLSPILILTGGLGSGKTELASNLSFSIADIENRAVYLIDLDNIKPYFKARNLRADYNKAGIRMVAPPEEYIHTDLPLLPPEARSIILNSKEQIIIDIGGDESGAHVLGGYSDEIRERQYDFFFVINTSRPYPCSDDEIITMIKNVEKESSLNLTGLINNTHMMNESTEAVFLQGRERALSVSEKTSIPLVMNSVYKNISLTSEVDEPVYFMDLYFTDFMT